MQSKEQAGRLPSEDPVREWMELMSEWEARSRALEEARTAMQRPGILLSDTEKAQLAKAEAAALDRLQQVKARIDALLDTASRQRMPVKGSLVMGTLLSDSQPLIPDKAPPSAGDGFFKRGN